MILGTGEKGREGFKEGGYGDAQKTGKELFHSLPVYHSTEIITTHRQEFLEFNRNVLPHNHGYENP